MVKGLKSILLTGMLLPLAIAPSKNTGSELLLDYKKEKVENFVGYLEKKEAFEKRNFIYSFGSVPQYSESSPGYCSTFCRLYGEENGKNYFWAGAGMRRKKDKLIGSLEDVKDPLLKIREWYFEGKIEKADIIGVWHRKADLDNKEYDPDTKEPWPYSHVISFEGVKVDSLKYACSESYRDSVKNGLAGELSFLHQGDYEKSTRIMESDLKERLNSQNHPWRIIEGITENPQAYAEAVSKNQDKKGS